ncbi:MAG: hypothetical protein J7525_19860 [Roseofilum sp. SID3]|uniref:exodeoxyribonuclease X C-terminal domain-containing protein n=1 Tax=Roseofilum sp. SID3 TaxID=2821499 RepID=UPI001B07ECB3|nr:hypothetical protein [Roseofilum sp. SID3]MBP0015353.1 hypothetical protein [Roseofilum sp. SID3]
MQITFGKHNGRSLEEILRIDPQYLAWGASNLESDRWRKIFFDFLQKHKYVQVESSSHGTVEFSFEEYCRLIAQWDDEKYPRLSDWIDDNWDEDSVDYKLNQLFKQWESEFQSTTKMLDGYRKIVEGTTPKFSSDEAREKFWRFIREYNAIVGEETIHSRYEKILRGATLDTVLVNQDGDLIEEREWDDSNEIELDLDEAALVAEHHELQGSPRQINWARAIMGNALEAIALRLKNNEPIQTSASWWINNRDNL